MLFLKLGFGLPIVKNLNKEWLVQDGTDTVLQSVDNLVLKKELHKKLNKERSVMI